MLCIKITHVFGRNLNAREIAPVNSTLFPALGEKIFHLYWYCRWKFIFSAPVVKDSLLYYKISYLLAYIVGSDVRISCYFYWTNLATGMVAIIGSPCVKLRLVISVKRCSNDIYLCGKTKRPIGRNQKLKKLNLAGAHIVESLCAFLLFPQSQGL